MAGRFGPSSHAQSSCTESVRLLRDTFRSQNGQPTVPESISSAARFDAEFLYQWWFSTLIGENYRSSLVALPVLLPPLPVCARVPISSIPDKPIALLVLEL